MKTTEQAMELAEALVAIGEEAGTPTVALLTDMESPMGNAIGNWPEVMETVECLGGAENPDVMEVTYELAAEMIVLGEKAKGIEEARQMAQDAIHSGRALKLFRDLVTAQGGHADSLDDPSQRLAEAKEYTVRYSGTDKGIVKQLNAFNCGLSAIALGAGRETKEDVVDPLAGIILARKPGDVVNPGDTLASLYSSDPERFEEAENILSGAFSYAQIGDQKSALKPERLLNRYSNGSWMHQPDTLSV